MKIILTPRARESVAAGGPSEHHMKLSALSRLLGGVRYRYGSEVQLHDVMSHVLAKDAFIAGEAKVMLISLRAGAGIDGLQHVCSTVVFGELDWSPGVHEQCIGRVHRDGQTEPVMAYFLISDQGSDPIVSEVLGVKREQIEGVRNPGEHLVERIDTGENQLRRLAQQFLASHGQAIPRATPPAELFPTDLEPA